MQFTVKYRSPNGSIVDEIVEAENRGECLSICKQRGITPLSAKEGKSSALNSKRQSANSSAKIIKWIVALTALAAIGIVAWFVSQKTPAEGKVPVEKARPKGLVKEVVPAKPRPLPIKTETEDEKKNSKPQRVGEIRNGYRLLPSGRLHKVHSVITTGVARVTVVEKAFKHDSDQMLAHLLLAQPGDSFVGDSEIIYAGFDEAFKKAILEPIEYDEKDDAYVREMKAGVEDLRKELSERMSAGENIIKILIETRNQMQELGHYRRELEEEVIKLSGDNGMTQKDYEDLLKAANEMLKERGSKPLELPSALKHTIKLNAVKRKTGEEK